MIMVQGRLLVSMRPGLSRLSGFFGGMRQILVELCDILEVRIRFIFRVQDNGPAGRERRVGICGLVGLEKEATENGSNGQVLAIGQMYYGGGCHDDSGVTAIIVQMFGVGCLDRLMYYLYRIRL